MDLDGRDAVSLNLPLTIEFSEVLSPTTIRPDTIQVRLGPRYGIQAFGDFQVSGNIVTFWPQLPVSADLSDSGLQPQAQYRVTVSGHPNVNHVQSYTGRPLVRTFTGSFATAAATSPDLFTTDTYREFPPPTVQTTNPPDVLPVSPWTQPGGAVNVATDAQIQVTFNKVPLLPSTITVNNVSLTMIERLGVAQSRPIQGTPVLQQSFDGVTLLFVPTFPLADQARYALRIENRVTDLTGNWDVADNGARAALRADAESGADPALTAFAIAHPEEVDPRTFLIFTTRDEPTKDLTIFMNFDGTDLDEDGGNGLDTNLSTASFNDAVPGAVAAVFTAAGGTGTLGAFSPNSNTTLSTNSPNAVNGAFNYASVRIPSNVTVVMTGTLPGQLLSLKSITIDGILGASGTVGQDGETGTYTSSSVNGALGGNGSLGGGKGGDQFTGTSFTGSGGNGAAGSNGGGGGGQGGKAVQSSAYGFGGGGGGGGHQTGGTAGQNGYYTSYSSWNAQGGSGGPAGGIQPTSAAVNDGKTFHTKGVGGGGGGAGGNFTYASQNWRGGAAGGGGGGGGILVKSAGDIVVTGTIVAMGGAGGNANNGSLYYYQGAGGGGGAGGSIVLFANAVLNVAGATLDTSGGSGGLAYASGWSGRGGNGGGGYVQLEDADGSVPSTGSATILPDYYTGTFDPTGTATDAPSVFVSTWLNMGVFDPILQGFSAQDFSEQNFTGCTIKYEMQMAREDPQDFGHADAGSINPSTGASSDLSRASNWQVFKDPVSGIQDITGAMNGMGYQFYRLRISFTLKDGQKRDDPVPYVERLRIRVKY
jgi:hypothetical protein